MMISYQTAYAWLNKFQDRSSYLTDFSNRLVNQLEVACLDQDMKRVRLFKELLLETSNNFDPGSPERAEILVILSRVAYSLQDFEEAVNLLREALQHYYPNNQHNIGVVQWLLGCVLWEIPGEQKLSIFTWQKSIEIFRPLANTYDSSEANWYKQVTREMENAFIESTEII
jgi:tetratricopeptide (TPR) repeat protein